MSGSECRKCHFVACICRRGERDPMPYFERQQEPVMIIEKTRPEMNEEFTRAEREAEAESHWSSASGSGGPFDPESRDTTTPGRGKKTATPKKKGPGSRYVEVPASAIHGALREAKFAEDVFGGEVVYKITHKKCKHITIQVLTSLPARGGDARALGEDAIRVHAVFSKARRDAKPGDRPFVRVFFKSSRVYRTGSVEKVIERMLERAREAYAAANEYCKSDSRCYECCGNVRGS